MFTNFLNSFNYPSFTDPSVQSYSKDTTGDRTLLCQIRASFPRSRNVFSNLQVSQASLIQFPQRAESTMTRPSLWPWRQTKSTNGALAVSAKARLVLLSLVDWIIYVGSWQTSSPIYAPLWKLASFEVTSHSLPTSKHDRFVLTIFSCFWQNRNEDDNNNRAGTTATINIGSQQSSVYKFALLFQHLATLRQLTQKARHHG